MFAAAFEAYEKGGYSPKLSRMVDAEEVCMCVCVCMCACMRACVLYFGCFTCIYMCVHVQSASGVDVSDSFVHSSYVY